MEPKTAFYDWLYINALLQKREALASLCRYIAFTDIEFAPDRSINCQARSCALFVALTTANLLDEAMSSAAAFVKLLGAPCDTGRALPTSLQEPTIVRSPV